MYVSKETFNVFARTRGTEYPYNEIMETRRRFYSKWILIFGPAGLPFQCLHAHAFDSNTLQHLMVSSRGLLLPPSMSKIMDAMDEWGRGRSSRWYHETLDLFWCHASRKISVTERELTFKTIKCRVYALIHSYLLDLQPGWTVFNEWEDYFNFLYDYDTEDFFHLARKSFDFVHNKLMAIVSSNNDNEMTPPTPVASVSSAALAAVSP